MSITVADMMPGTLNCARNVMPVHPGEDVLLIADTTTNPDIAQAYKIAYESEGGKVSILTIPATSAGGSSHEITHHTLYGRYNKVVVEALKGADLGINLSGFADMHGIFGAGHTFFGMKPTDYWEKYKTRILSVTIACKEQLASDWATYPQPLLDYIEYRAHKQVEEIAAGDMDHIKLHITDPEGTDFSLEGFQLCTKGSLNKPIFRPGAPSAARWWALCLMSLLPMRKAPLFPPRFIPARFPGSQPPSRMDGLSHWKVAARSPRPGWLIGKNARMRIPRAAMPHSVFPPGRASTGWRS